MYGKVTEQQTSTDAQEQNSIALVNVITPEGEWFYSPSPSIYLSILPSFFSRLPPSIDTLHITFVFPLGVTTNGIATLDSKLTYLSLECVETARDKDSVLNLCVTFNFENITVTFGKQPASLGRTSRMYWWGPKSWTWADPFTCTIPVPPETRSRGIFEPVALLCTSCPSRFVPIYDDKSPLCHSPSTIIQLSLPTASRICSISRLPVELISLIFDFVKLNKPWDTLCLRSTISTVCKLWMTLSVPYWWEPLTIKGKHARLKLYPNASRLWGRLWFKADVNVGMAKEVSSSVQNVREVWFEAFWNKKDAGMLLNAIATSTVERVTFGHKGLRKWGKEEVENFMSRMKESIKSRREGSIKWLVAHDVEDSCSSSCDPSASTGLPLPSDLTILVLKKYPHLSSLSLPQTLQNLTLANMCPLPPSILSHPLPPALTILSIKLAPFSSGRKISILPAPLDLSHLKHLSDIVLDGGEETSNLTGWKFFRALKSATGIGNISLSYCTVDLFDFQDFVPWFFADRWVIRVKEDGSEEKKFRAGTKLLILLFFGDWQDEEFRNATRAMRECGWTEEWESRVWEESVEEEERSPVEQ
ncbi:hypothetical protein BT69DRAFT_1338955 [Atractiella rhizophila]|nr:hypothetical protein BT69DRAFT_1338955 [Atractiella rhizophila]